METQWPVFFGRLRLESIAMACRSVDNGKIPDSLHSPGGGGGGLPLKYNSITLTSTDSASKYEGFRWVT